MSHYLRFRYAFATTVLVAMILAVIEIVFAVDLTGVLMSLWFAIPTFVLAWLAWNRKRRLSSEAEPVNRE